MTFLELCKALHLEAGMAGAGPASVTGQTGILKKVVDWVARAYLEVQNEEERWRWLWREKTFVTVPGQREYHPTVDLQLENFESWEQDSFYVRRPSAEQRFPVFFIEWAVFRNYTATVPSGQFLHFTFKPDNTLKLDSTPTTAETVEFEYWRGPFEFVNNTDVPAFPAHHHKIILYKALMYYAADEEAPVIYQDAERNYLRYLERLRRNELIQPHVRQITLA